MHKKINLASIIYILLLAIHLFNCSSSDSPSDNDDDMVVIDDNDNNDDPDNNDDQIEYTTVNTIEEFIATLHQNDVNIKLTPGTYRFGPDDITSGLIPNNEMFIFRGNNTNYDFTGVKFEFKTELWSAYGYAEVRQLRLIGDNITLKNLTIEDIGMSAPAWRAQNIILDGTHNTIDGFNITSRGSYPYGYGDLFGKGGQNTISHRKHSTLLIRGENNTLKNTTIISRSYGHLVFVQGGIDILIENVNVEGELRTTDDILLEEGTGSPADNINFLTVFGYKVPPGYMISLQEAGFRCYTSGSHYITGETTRTERVTIKNCTATRVRSAFNTIFGTGPHIIENCTAIECETGFAIKAGNALIGCKADAKYGPAYNSGYNNDGDQQIELEILNSEGSYGTHPIAFIGGTEHRVTFTSSDNNVSQERPIQVGGILKIHRLLDLATPDPIDTRSSTLFNNTKYPVLLTSNSTTNSIYTCADVTDEGNLNFVSNEVCN